MVGGLGNVLVATCLGLVCRQSSMLVGMLMELERERERACGTVLQLVVDQGHKGVTEALLGC